MIKIICVGKIKEKFYNEAIEEYKKRLSKYTKLEINGKELNSKELSEKIEKIFITNPNITFIIGGSYGLDTKILNISNYSLSFSKLTFPHQLFRVILLEQIYRAYRIINNENYHK